jgi:hypothetical protein
MPLKLSYKFTKIISTVETEHQFFIDKVKIILDKYSEKDNLGQPIVENNNYKIKEEFLTYANQEIEELYNLEIALPDITFTLDELESLNIKPADLRALLPFIKED